MIFLDEETTHLDADIGMLVAIGLILPDNSTKILFADRPENEKEIIRESLDMLRKFEREPICVWYSAFDIPFLLTRAIKNGLNASNLFNFNFIDLCRFAQQNLKLQSNKLDDVCRFFGIKKNFAVAGRDVQKLYLRAMGGDESAKEAIINHCRDDLRGLREIFEILRPYVERWKLNNFRKRF